MSGTPFLSVSARQAQVLEEVAHRPCHRLPSRGLRPQTRQDVLFAHWRVPLADLARLLPPGLPLDTHEGEAWLGITPFRLANLRLRGLPPVPGISFDQLDIRTYVTLEGRPGIWFCSVDASNVLLVEAARRAHRLPAYRARISAGGAYFEASRDGLSFKAAYRSAGDTFTADSGSLAHFLTERYCIYTADGGRLYRAELHHRPWSLQRAEATIESTTIAPVPLEGEPYLLYAGAQDMLVWSLEEL